MELFAIASVSHDHNIDWLSFKFISDDANESASQEWSKHVNQGQKLFLEKLQAHSV
jgi:adenosylhomocysteine nucleosidase